MKALSALFGIGFLLRLVLALRTCVINTDALVFLTVAKEFLAGKWKAAAEAGFHPLYPALIALGGGSETAAVAISIVAGVLAGWPLFLLVRDLADQRTALVALAVYETHPTFVDVQSEVYADGIFLLFTAMALAGSLRFVIHGKGRELALCGAALGCFTKSEGLIVAMLTVATFGIAGGWVKPLSKDGLRRLGVCAFAGVAILAPLVLYIWVSSGKLRLSPKQSVDTLVPGGDIERGSGTWAQRREAYGSFLASFWYLGISWIRSLRRFYALAAVLSLAFLGRWGEVLKAKRWLGMWAAVYAFCVWFFNFKGGHQISPRYLLPPSLVLLVFTACAGVRLWDRLDGRRWLRNAGLAAAAGTAILLSLWDGIPGRRWMDLPLREAGEWIRREKGEGRIIATQSDKPVWYAKGTMRPWPQVVYAEVELAITVDPGPASRPPQDYELLKEFSGGTGMATRYVGVYGRKGR